MVINFQTLLMISIIFIVALLAFFLMTLGILSYKTIKDKRRNYVYFAFATYFLKNTFIALSLLFDVVPHGTLEFLGALFDLLTMIFLVLPIIAKTKV